MQAVQISNGYVPRALQASLHARLNRFNVVVCHRRFGKTIFAINHMIHKALKNKLVRPRYIYVAPTLREAKKIAWDYFKAYTSCFPGVTFNEQELRIDIPLDDSGLNTIRFQLLGADNPTSLKGAYYDGVILDEYAEMHPMTFTEAIRPALSDRKGWVIFIGTPKGKNSFWEMYEYASKSGDPEWFSAIYRASETGIIDEHELASNRRTMSEDEYNQEFECSFTASSVGSYYGREMAQARQEGRIRRVAWEPILPVNTAWDLGLDDAMAVWFYQQLRDEIRVLAYMQWVGQGFKDVAPILFREKYTYGKHLMPWDIVVREISDGVSRKEKAEALGIKPIVAAKKLSVQDGIQHVRDIFHRCYFDEEGCSSKEVGVPGGLDCLNEYKKKWDAKKQIFLPEPLHDQFSHGADAFRTLAVGLEDGRPVKKNLPGKANTPYNVFRRK